MAAERLIAAGLLWALVVWGLWLCRRQSPLHLGVLSLSATGLVGSFFPLLSLFVPPATWRNVSHLSPELLLSVQVDYAAFAAGLLLALLVAAQRGWLAPRGEPPHPSAWTLHRDAFIAAGLAAGGAALYALYVARVGLGPLLSREDYAEKYLVSVGMGPLAFGLPLMIAGCLWAEDAALPRRPLLVFRALGGALAVWSIAFISVRTNAVILLLGYLYVLGARRGFELRRVRVSLLAVLLAGYAALESFSLFRDVYRGDAGEALRILQSRGDTVLAAVVGGSELSHPFVTAAEVAAEREGGELRGRSLVDGVVALAPLGILPDRPLTLSEQFVRHHYPVWASRGGGAAFSLVAEAWLDFGPILGPALAGCAVGAVVLVLERRRRTRAHGMLARLAPYLAFFVLVEHRNEFATLLKQVLPLAACAAALWVAADAAWWIRARRGRALSGGLAGERPALGLED